MERGAGISEVFFINSIHFHFVGYGSSLFKLADLVGQSRNRPEPEPFFQPVQALFAAGTIVNGARIIRLLTKAATPEGSARDT